MSALPWHKHGNSSTPRKEKKSVTWILYVVAILEGGNLHAIGVEHFLEKKYARLILLGFEDFLSFLLVLSFLFSSFHGGCESAG